MNEFFADDQIGFDDWDTSDIDTEKCESTRTVDKPGMYHFQVGAVKLRPEKEDNQGHPRKPDILLTNIVLHSVKDQCPEGAIYYHEIVVGGKGGGRCDIGKNGVRWDEVKTCAFLAGLGILKKEQRDEKEVFVDSETGSSNLNNDFWGRTCQKLDGMQWIGDIKVEKGGENPSTGEKYQDRYQLNFGKGAYYINHPAVVDVPKNKEALALIGGEASPASAPETTPAPTETAPTETASEQFAGL